MTKGYMILFCQAQPSVGESSCIFNSPRPPGKVQKLILAAIASLYGTMSVRLSVCLSVYLSVTTNLEVYVCNVTYAM